MVKIKICGLRREEDIAFVNSLGVDYAGFVFAPGRRQINLSRAAKLVTKLAKGISKVGVFVNAPRPVIEQHAAALGLDVIQLHGDEGPADTHYQQLVWKAFRVRDAEFKHQLSRYTVDGILLDAPAGGTYGGSGQTFDWLLTQGINLRVPLILAGGLQAANVAAAMRIVQPAVVDVSSGVEVNGYKDFSKMEQFVERVRRHADNTR